jgi:hypothetical protein
MISTKVCKRCGPKKSTTGFYKAASNKDGLDHICKVCRIAANKLYREEHREQVKANYEKWLAAHPERRKEINERHYQKNKARLKRERDQKKALDIAAKSC